VTVRLVATEVPGNQLLAPSIASRVVHDDRRVDGDEAGIRRAIRQAWVDIQVVNKLQDVNLIYVGQELIIPAQGVAR
jgi:hypothetical protein